MPLGQVYFFRTAERSGSIGSKPFTGSAVNNRQRKPLSEAKLYAGETPHSFRLGLSKTLRLLGCSSEDVAHYLGWKSGEVAKRYVQGSGAAVSLAILERVFPRAASGTVSRFHTPITCRRLSKLRCCVYSITALAFLFCLGLR